MIFAAGRIRSGKHLVVHTVPLSIPMDISGIPDHRITIEKRDSGLIVVRIQSEGDEHSRLPDAVFSFRCGDPQYAYWLGRLEQKR